MKYLRRIFYNDVVGSMQELYSRGSAIKDGSTANCPQRPQHQHSPKYTTSYDFAFHTNGIQKHRFVPTSKGRLRSTPTKGP
jgi:hypothetical protein